MVPRGLRACRGSSSRVLACSALLIGMLAGAWARPAAADVVSVSGSAFGYYVNAGLFGGPRTLQGHGQAVYDSASDSPSVKLPPEGSPTAITLDDPDGARAVYGPAFTFGGIWPDSAASAPPSGPLSVSTQGEAHLDGTGSVTSSAGVRLYDTPQPVPCRSGHAPPCLAPGGFGPGPVIGDRALSTCTTNESGSTGSSTFVNGKVETKYDAGTQLPVPGLTVPIPPNPPPNWTVSGSDQVGDRFTVVMNEQIIGPDSITVNAAHLYLLGDVARGDMVLASSTCGVASSVTDGAPTANDDAFSTLEDTPLTVAAPGLLANDTDPDIDPAADPAAPPVGDPLTATTAQSVYVPGPDEPASSAGTVWTFPSVPLHGRATVNGDGSFIYTPDANFSGTDTFTYGARDPRGAFDTGIVTILVDPVPDAPVAVEDTAQAVQGTPLSVAAPGVLANDSDGDGDRLVAGSASDPPHGSVVLSADGSYTYTPDAGFLGTDTFTYTVSDGTGLSDTAFVTIGVAVDGATLVRDINPGPDASSVPTSVTTVGSTVFFAANDGTHGTELWKTDGTAAGTVLVKDIQVGAGGSSPGNFTEFNGALYFSASDGFLSPASGNELWRSDGTAAGTVMIKDISPGSNGSSPGSFRAVGSTLYFSASNGTAAGQNGVELWKTDGTQAGTVLVKDINVGTASSSPGGFASVGSTLYFSATNGTAAGQNGLELWKSDGTAAGTVLVKDINPGTAGSSPVQLTTIGTTLFFRAIYGVAGVQNGAELWKSDGTTAGTVLVKDINLGTASSNPTSLTVLGSTLLFSATDGDASFGTELWKSDGTAAGTVLVANINSTANSFPSQLKVFGSTVLFSALGGTGSNGTELWRSDGTAAGTQLVKDINPGLPGSNPSQLTVVGNVVYFTAVTAASGTELWKTDGTANGTVLAEDINQGSASSSPSSLTPALGTMFFSATDATAGTELWRLPPSTSAVLAGDDAYSTTEDTPLTVPAPGVLGNDTGPGTLSAGSATFPAHGTVTLNAAGSFVYTPAANFAGTDSFSYTSSSDRGGTDTGMVTITVTAVNDAPVAVNDAVGTAEDTAVTVPAPGLLGNDTDIDSPVLTALKVSNPAHGSVTVNANGSFTYTPAANFNGPDSFTYKANDGTIDSNVATVNITVTAVNDAPVAVNDAAATAKDTPVTVSAPGVLGNDLDVDGPGLTAVKVSNPAHGSVTLSANGSFTYTPAAGFSGADSFTYKANDGSLDSNAATVSITISAGANAAPVAGNDAYSTNEDSALTVTAPGVLGNDTDPDGNALAAGSASTPGHGIVTLAANGSFTYTPVADFNGADSFTYVLTDGQGGTATGMVTINVIAPVGVGFHPLTPARILDSRPAPSQVGPYGTPWGAGQTRDVTVTGAGVPAGADAVVLNVTVTGTTGAGYLTIWPAGQPQPLASSLNWAPGQTVPNAVTVKVGAGGRVSVLNPVGDANVLFDVVGYYDGAGGDGFTSLTPTRILDSRPAPSQVGPYGTPWTPGQTRDVTVTGGEVPAAAEAVVLNVTVTGTTAAGYLTIWPAGQPQPLASSLNWAPGQTIPNAVTVKVGAGGRISVLNPVGSTDVIVDVVGYFAAGSGQLFHPLSPARVQDSRPGGPQVGPYGTPWGAGSSRDVQVAGAGGVPGAAAAALLNVTATGTSAPSYLTIWPAGQAAPLASSLNWGAGQTIPNSVTTKLGAGGRVSVLNAAGNVDVLVDVAGWYG